jgi:hypothetical protein
MLALFTRYLIIMITKYRDLIYEQYVLRLTNNIGKKHINIATCSSTIKNIIKQAASKDVKTA